METETNKSKKNKVGQIANLVRMGLVYQILGYGGSWIFQIFSNPDILEPIKSFTLLLGGISLVVWLIALGLVNIIQRAIYFYLVRIIVALSFLSSLLVLVIWVPGNLLGPPGWFFQLLIIVLLLIGFYVYYKTAFNIVLSIEDSISSEGYFDSITMEWGLDFDVVLADETEDARRKVTWYVILIQVFALTISCIAAQNYSVQIAFYLIMAMTTLYGLRATVEDLVISSFLLAWEKTYSGRIMLKKQDIE
jgi:hypothetical protein